MATDIYAITATALDGSEIDLGRYRGDVLLIVNTASRCGFTPQFAGLQQLHESYAEQGLRVLGFPCNQFLNQEPGDADEIAQFCQRNYGVDFQMFAKIDVNGGATHPLYRLLKRAAPGALGSTAVKWNFTKFLVDRSGQVLRRYPPSTEPAELVADLERALATPAQRVA